MFFHKILSLYNKIFNTNTGCEDRDINIDIKEIQRNKGLSNKNLYNICAYHNKQALKNSIWCMPYKLVWERYDGSQYHDLSTEAVKLKNLIYYVVKHNNSDYEILKMFFVFPDAQVLNWIIKSEKLTQKELLELHKNNTVEYNDETISYLLNSKKYIYEHYENCYDNWTFYYDLDGVLYNPYEFFKEGKFSVLFDAKNEVLYLGKSKYNRSELKKDKYNKHKLNINNVSSINETKHNHRMGRINNLEFAEMMFLYNNIDTLIIKMNNFSGLWDTK